MNAWEIAAGWTITGALGLGCGVYWGGQLYAARIRRAIRKAADRHPSVPALDPERLRRWLDQHPQAQVDDGT